MMRLARAVLYGAVILLLTTPEGGAADVRRVLVLHTFGLNFSPFFEFSRSFRTELLTKSKGPVDLYEAAIFTARFDEHNDEQSLGDYLGTLFAGREPDLIVTVGAPAMQFVQKHRQRFFKNAPLLITGIASRRIEASALTELDTVYAVTLDLRAFVENILRVRPGTREIVVVSGNSPLEKSWTGQLRREYAAFAKRVRFTWWNELSAEEMVQRAARLGPRSAMLYFWVVVDADGVTQPLDRVLPALRKTTTAPIFGFGEYHLGQGIVGGPLVPQFTYGREAAEIALRILAGERPAAIRTPPAKIGKPVYDWRELRRWDISEARLPPGSAIRFHEATVWEAYRWQIVSIAAAILAQALLIAGLLYERRRRRQAEAEGRSRLLQLKRMDRHAAAGELSASLAHEIRQPLAAIVSNADAALIWLKDKAPKLDEIAESLRSIASDGHRANAVIESVRNLYKQDFDERTHHSVNKLVSEVLALLRPELHRHQIAIHSAMSEEMPLVYVNPVQIQQVILNLVLNAIDAMEQTDNRQRVLTVRTEAEETGEVYVRIADTGPGMPPERLNRIFEPFFTTKSRGTGMGLAISRSIVESHGGRLTAMPGRPSKGMIFQIELPAQAVGSALDHAKPR